MIRITAYGLLVGWGNVALWMLLPMPGTWLAMFLWYVVRYEFNLRHPVQRRLKEALAEKNEQILMLKAQLGDTATELVRALKSETALRDVAEEMRNSNRNLNARATEALK